MAYPHAPCPYHILQNSCFEEAVCTFYCYSYTLWPANLSQEAQRHPNLHDLQVTPNPALHTTTQQSRLAKM